MLLRGQKPKVSFLLAVNPATAAARELRLIRLESSVGSGESNDLRIRDDSVSRHHALVRQWQNRWQVIDRGSTNGTYVGERKAIDWIVLGDGEEVRFGGARFIFRSGKRTGARATRDLPVRRRSSSVRVVTVLVAAGLVSGFAAKQYYLYRWYQARADHSRSALSVQSSPKPAIVTEALSNPPAPSEPSWLQRVNHWRELAGLRTVSSTPELNAAAVEHSRYLVKHVLEGKIEEVNSGGAHTEDPSDPWYTRSGVAAAQSGDVTPPCRDCMSFSPSQHVDDFMAIPFHRLNVLDPALTKIGYGSYTENGFQAAVLYLPVPSEAGTPFTPPIEFPPDGSSVEFAAYQSDEWPDPLSSCPGYTAPSGLPITLELGRWIVASVSDYSLKVGERTLASCVFDASTYNNPDDATQARGRNGLKAYGAAVLIPRQPLTSGQTYAVSISANGKTYGWSFSVE
jgi:uncharacterized protein YkwD